MNNVKKPVYGKGAPLERAVKAALQDAADCPALPADFGRRVEAIVEMQSRSKGRGFMKIAASVAVCVSLVGFAAWQIAERVGGEGEKSPEPVPQTATPVAVLPEGLCNDNTQKSGEKSMNAIKKTAVLTATIAAAVSSTAQATARSSVFDDVKVWYKGSAGNAVGTADSSGNQICHVKNLPQLSDSSSSMHGGDYYWWGWRMSYENQPVVCPYANVSLDSTPCMVVHSPVTTNSMETVTIDGVEQQQPNISYRTGDLHFTNWLADRNSACDSYTLVLRFRNEAINPVPGDHNRVIGLGNVWTSTAGYAAGVDLRMVTQEALGSYSCPRIVVGANQQEPTNVRIQDGKWVDCAIVVSGLTLTATFCWEDAGTNALSRVSYTYSASAASPAIAANGKVTIGGGDKASCTFTRGVYLAQNDWTWGFRGAFHQIAFWNRTLSDDEIREAMSGGTGRPNLVQVGMEGNGVNEFATSAQTASVSNAGAWENLNPTLNAENSTATIAFDCPALWAGQAQWLRIPIASGNGSLAASINGTTLGTATAVAGGIGRIFVPANVIASGANSLVITRLQGSFAIDAVTLGGSWKFGESVGSFANAPNTPDQFVFNPAGGNDKFRDRTLKNSTGGETQFRFYVPGDLVGRVRGVFTTRVQNTGTGYPTYDFEFLANGSSLGTYGLKGGNEYEVKVPVDGIVAGWNTFAWKRLAGWANIDWHKFELHQPPKGLLLVVR